MKKFTQVLKENEKIRREVRLVLALVQQVSESIAGAADAEGAGAQLAQPMRQVLKCSSVSNEITVEHA